jgi:hypothetical protein
LRDDVITDVKIAGPSDHREREGRYQDSQSLMRSVGLSSESPSEAFCDQAGIRGHRRTYIASGAWFARTGIAKGRSRGSYYIIVSPYDLALRCPEFNDSRDEIDKVGHHGDPAATLLDPEQNVAFNVWLIYILANTLDTTAPPLLDRCEVIQLSDYCICTIRCYTLHSAFSPGTTCAKWAV